MKEGYLNYSASGTIEWKKMKKEDWFELMELCLDELKERCIKT